MVLIGDYTWVLYVVFGTLAALLACYGVALLVVSRVSRPKREREQAQPVAGAGMGARPVAG